jgi:hypothetical protein
MAKLAYLVGIAVLFAPPAIAQTAPAGQATAKESPSSENDLDRIVCRKEERIGSRLGAKKVCLTVKEWQDLAQANREEVERAQLNTGVRPGS